MLTSRSLAPDGFQAPLLPLPTLSGRLHSTFHTLPLQAKPSGMLAMMRVHIKASWKVLTTLSTQIFWRLITRREKNSRHRRLEYLPLEVEATSPCSYRDSGSPVQTKALASHQLMLSITTILFTIRNHGKRDMRILGSTVMYVYPFLY